MTRQVHELGLEQYGSRGHITSLNPIRPANAADEWETKALQAFEQGIKEVSSVEKLDNENYMRLMRPLITEQGCLKCHADQGYKAGDLRGGISVSIPIAPIQAVARGHTLTLTAGYFALWLLGVGGTSLGVRRLKQRIQDHKYAEEQIANLAKFPSENPNPVLRISSDGTILYANQPSQPVLETWERREGERIPEPCRERLKEAFDSGKVYNFEFPCRNGQIFSVTISPVLQSGYANAYGLDITERKEAEEELKRQRYYLAKAQEMGAIGTWDLDIKKNKLVWTDENYHIFGLLPGMELTYEIFLNCVHPDDREYVDKKWKAALEHEPYDIVHRLIVDGQVKWVREKAEVEFDKEGNCVRGIGFTQDITERRQAEREIENLAKFPSENPNPVLRISAEGTLLYANHTADSIIHEWDCQIGQAVPDMWRKTTVEVLANKRQKRIEYRHDNKIFAFLIVPVIEAGYANLYGRDITERKAAEEDLQKHQQQLEELVEIRTAELREVNKQLMAEIEGRKQLEREILDISERERRRLGEELHDSLGQQLTGIAFMTKVLERKLAETSPNEVADVVEIAKLVGQATDQARGLARGLHPLDLGAESLMSSLEELARQTRELIGVRCFFRCDEAVKVDDAGVAVHLYRIAQEAVTNAIKHGKAKNIE
ncbi:MAG: c-type heme family protein, partial [Planctomycetota bacterium]